MEEEVLKVHSEFFEKDPQWPFKLRQNEKLCLLARKSVVLAWLVSMIPLES